MRNQVFLVFDSLRYDVLCEAETPFLKSLGAWKKAWSPGSFTFPAHMSFFMGKIPQCFDGSDYADTVATRFQNGKRFRGGMQLWRLANPESRRPSLFELSGLNVIEGFAKKGFTTIGTGAVNWFNPDLAPGQYLSGSFEHFRFFREPRGREHCSAEKQIDWALDRTRSSKRPFFLFMNFGETHHWFRYSGCPWIDGPDPYGDASECKRRQKACIEYLDRQVERLLKELRDWDLVACSDHGEAMGEDGLWGHGFFHPTVMEVPLLTRIATKQGIISKIASAAREIRSEVGRRARGQ